MSRLFIALYLDEDVDVLVAELMRARGFEVVTTYEAGNPGKSDIEQLRFATRAGWVLPTHNRRDFEDLARRYATAGPSHAGLNLAVRRSPYEIARRLLVILNHVTADEMVNQVRYI